MARCPFFLLFVLCAIGWQIASAQYRFDSWTTDNGLPQNGVRQITQTPDGYLWLTTFDGLVRFDGVKFTVFDAGNTKGIINNRFSAIYAAPDGTLWAGTEDGVLTVRRGGFFTSYPAERVPGKFIHEFRTDANGETLIRLDDELYYLRGDGEFAFAAALEPEFAPKKTFDGKSGTRWEITPDQTRRLKDGGVTIYSFKFDTKREIWNNVYEDGRGDLWLGVVGGLYHLRAGGAIVRYAEKDGIPSDTAPHSFWEEADGSLWFATGDWNLAGAGLFQFKDGRFNRFGAEAGLSNDRIINVFKDREGIIWIATNKGLNRLRRQIITTLSTKDGLLHNEVYPILQGRDEIFIGTVEGLSRYRGKFFNQRFGGQNGVYENLQALFEDAEGRLFVGGIGGAFVYENGERKNLIEDDKTVAVITSDRSGNIWVGSSGGLSKINNYQVTARYTTSEGLPGNDVKEIYEDREGNLWIGTYSGLAVLSPDFSGQSEQSPLKVLKTYTTKDGLASNRVRSIYEDTDGVLWIGTYDGGLSRFKDGKFFNFTTDNGLFNNGVFATLEDGRGNFWISCNKGIYRVSRQQLNDFADGRIAKYESVAYGKEDGMLNTECNGGRQPSALKDKDGRFWFPTLEGVAIVNPDLVAVNPLPPPVEIETIAVDREPLSSEKLHSAIGNANSTIEVGSSQTSLDITYTGLSFINSSQIRFKYRLEGLDKDWIDAGTRRTVNYSYLPPGEYTFTVTAANSDGVWNAEGKSIKVVVIAPFYRTWWFLILCALAAILIIRLFYGYRLAQLEKINAAKSAYTQKLIEQQESERRRIALELHDSIGQSLSIIRNRALMSLSTPDKHDRIIAQMEEISEAAADSITEVRQISHNLHPYQLEHLGLTAALETMIETAENSSHIKFETKIEDVDDALSKEAEINLYRVVQECLNNILKHSGATKAVVSLRKDGDVLDLQIEDNGKGFDMENSFKPKSGLGLTGIAERAKMLNAQYKINSTPNSGTIISLQILLIDK